MAETELLPAAGPKFVPEMVIVVADPVGYTSGLKEDNEGLAYDVTWELAAEI